MTNLAIGASSPLAESPRSSASITPLAYAGPLTWPSMSDGSATTTEAPERAVCGSSDSLSASAT